MFVKVKVTNKVEYNRYPMHSPSLSLSLFFVTLHAASFFVSYLFLCLLSSTHWFFLFSRHKQQWRCNFVLLTCSWPELLLLTIDYVNEGKLWVREKRERKELLPVVFGLIPSTLLARFLSFLFLCLCFSLPHINTMNLHVSIASVAASSVTGSDKLTITVTLTLDMIFFFRLHSALPRAELDWCDFHSSNEMMINYRHTEEGGRRDKKINEGEVSDDTLSSVHLHRKSSYLCALESCKRHKHTGQSEDWVMSGYYLFKIEWRSSSHCSLIYFAQVKDNEVTNTRKTRHI